MEHPLIVYNSLTRKKEQFVPLNPPFAGMYVCGPTVYGDAHLGHARPAITFDLVFRYLTHLGYRVRYVRNITDVGHLENDSDSGEDKIGKKARLEQLEPMEVVQYYTDRYHADMDQLNVLKPSIEPRASGHIIEQIEMIKSILQNGFAYEADGSVYFDVHKYNTLHHYGKLSGRVIEQLMEGYRNLDGQEQKRNPEDFALWKKAEASHIMRWPSPWGDGFPGWHIECSVMSSKYLGDVFDIHGGGMDLLFPHHECEIAQNRAASGKDAVRYWLHNNMITINGQKMGKSLGNFITLGEFFNGQHPALEQAYSGATIRFFVLQAHYRSTLDFGNEALKAAEKGLKRLQDAYGNLTKVIPKPTSTVDIATYRKRCYDALNDDFNSPLAIAALFDAARTINAACDGKENLTEADIASLTETFHIFFCDILAINSQKGGNQEKMLDIVKGLMNLILEYRQDSRQKKDWAASDKIRDGLQGLGIVVKDGKEGASYTVPD
ncbi:MAG TPA: cysteine--tRNA ligase [Bacteroidales bacterium]|nr:cysteine--tRNA ligase [Bacteroidales bacterium]